MMDPIQRNTWMALGIALILHLAAIPWLYHQERVLVVPLSAELLSTTLGLSPGKQPEIMEQKPPKSEPRPPRRLPREASIPISQTRSAPVKVAAESSSPPQEKTEPSGGGATGQATQDDIRKYINGVVRKIDRKKHYPPIAKENGEEGLVIVKMTLGRGGQLLHYHLTRQNPSDRLNQATLASVQAAAPFPPLPESYPNAEIIIEVPVRFRLAKNL